MEHAIVTRAYRRHRFGLNLVEVVVAVFLFSLMLVATIWYFPRSALVIKRSEAAMHAERLSSNLLQELHGQSWESLTPGIRPIEKFVVDGIEFRRRLEIHADPEGNDSLREVRVSVEWEERGQARQYPRITWITPLSR